FRRWRSRTPRGIRVEPGGCEHDSAERAGHRPCIRSSGQTHATWARLSSFTSWMKSRSPAIFVNIWERKRQVRDNFRNDCGFAGNLTHNLEYTYRCSFALKLDKTCLTAGQMERLRRSGQ